VTALGAPRRALSFDSNPPLSLPLRYFLTAPLFAALAAGLLAWHGEAALLTRWSPLTLALTHLMVLGCLSMTMIGALLQMLPVVAGITVPHVGRVGATVHLGLSAGTLLLAYAFWSGLPTLFALAMATLLASLLLFLGACTVGMWRPHANGSGAVVAGIRLALTALVLTATLGGILAGAFAWPDAAQLPLMRLTDLHAMWGLLGWVGLLVIAVAFQVVPMFMLTEPYPSFLTGSYTTWLFMLLVAASLSSGLPGAGLLFHQLCLILLAAGYALFAGVTLYLLARRKRPQADPTTLYWRVAMGSVVAALVLWLSPEAQVTNAKPLALGVLLIAGFALSAINGMLYKIVPFLAWYHLQEEMAASGRKLPAVNKVIAEGRAKWQLAAHLTSLLLLLGACYAPALVRAAAALMCVACVGLWLNLCGAALLRRRMQNPA
jgi:hypothetical protein